VVRSKATQPQAQVVFERQREKQRRVPNQTLQAWSGAKRRNHRRKLSSSASEKSNAAFPLFTTARPHSIPLVDASNTIFINKIITSVIVSRAMRGVAIH